MNFSTQNQCVASSFVPLPQRDRLIGVHDDAIRIISSSVNQSGEGTFPWDKSLAVQCLQEAHCLGRQEFSLV